MVQDRITSELVELEIPIHAYNYPKLIDVINKDISPWVDILTDPSTISDILTDDTVLTRSPRSAAVKLVLNVFNPKGSNGKKLGFRIKDPTGSISESWIDFYNKFKDLPVLENLNITLLSAFRDKFVNARYQIAWPRPCVNIMYMFEYGDTFGTIVTKISVQFAIYNVELDFIITIENGIIRVHDLNYKNYCNARPSMSIKELFIMYGENNSPCAYICIDLKSSKRTSTYTFKSRMTSDYVPAPGDHIKHIIGPTKLENEKSVSKLYTMSSTLGIDLLNLDSDDCQLYNVLLTNKENK